MLYTGINVTFNNNSNISVELIVERKEKSVFGAIHHRRFVVSVNSRNKNKKKKVPSRKDMEMALS